MTRPLLATCALALILTAGCATDPPVPGRSATDVVAPGQSIAERQQASDFPLVEGYRLRIAELGVDTSFGALDLNPDRTVQVPPLEQVETAGLYARGPRPGEVGPAVVLGHVNSGGRDGVFARLGELAVGDRINVDTPTGPREFRVSERAVVPKDAFPTARVYSDTPGPELRLVTCGGEYDAASRNYQSNVIVFAQEAP